MFDVLRRTSVPNSEAVVNRRDIERVAAAMNKAGYILTGGPRIDFDDLPDLAKESMMQMAKVAMEKTREIDRKR